MIKQEDTQDNTIGGSTKGLTLEDLTAKTASMWNPHDSSFPKLNELVK